MTIQELQEFKNLCRNIKNHPKCPDYAARYCQAAVNDNIVYRAQEMGRSVEEAVDTQILYILSNLNSVRDPELKAHKAMLRNWHLSTVKPLLS